MTKKRNVEKIYKDEKDEKFDKKFREWAETTTCHGIADLARAQTTRAKCIWCLLILSCIAFMIYQVYIIMHEFSRHKWTSSTYEETRYSVRLPTVTMCNYNRFQKSEVEKYEMPEDAMRYMYNMADVIQGNVIDDPTPDADATVKRQQQIYTVWRRKYGLTFNDVIKVMGSACSDMFVDYTCYLQRNRIHAVKPIATIEYQKCMQYDPINDRFQPKDALAKDNTVGVRPKNQFVMNVQKHEHVEVSEKYPKGFAVQLSYNKLEIAEWIHVPPGTHVRLTITKREDRIKAVSQSFLNPFSFLDSMPPCVSEAEQNQSQYADGYTYTTRSSCIIDCLFAKAIKYCKCIPYQWNKQIRTCEAEEILQCLELESIYAIKTARDKCKVNCHNHKPCVEDSLETRVTFSKFPAQNQLKNLAKMINLGNNSESQWANLILLDIVLDSLIVKVVERYPMVTIELLISNVGGLLSLWTGMSFITFFQFVAFVADRVKPRSRHVTPETMSETDWMRSCSTQTDGPAFCLYVQSQIHSD